MPDLEIFVSTSLHITHYNFFPAKELQYTTL